MTAAPVLRAGETCWRIEAAARMAVIIDAADYFAHLKAAILKARRSVFLIGWDFDPRTALERGPRRRDVPNRIGPLLHRAVRRNPELYVRVLWWDLSFVKTPIRGTLEAMLLDWRSGPQLSFRMDSHHPAAGCHHQKIAVIDDALAFCGGIDVTGGRWDTRAHLDDDRRRWLPGGGRCGPWHDATTAVDGAAARAFSDLARLRWKRATGETLTPLDAPLDPWPDKLRPGFRNVEVGIARTEPAFSAEEGAREIEALYLAAIGSARHLIYLESQYFASHRIAAALGQRLQEPDGPEVVIVNPIRAEGWLEEQAMGAARAVLLGRMREADTHHRLRFVTPVTRGGADIYVHAKVLIVDDALIRVGSSNINNRSLGLDTECDLAVEADGCADPAAVRLGIADVLHSLLAEHLGVAPHRVVAVRAAADGSITAVLDRLMRSDGKTLVRFDPPETTDAMRLLAATRALDPQAPEAAARNFRRAVRSAAPGWLTKRTVGASVVALAGAWWLLHRRSVAKPTAARAAAARAPEADPPGAEAEAPGRRDG